jgi:hypothetical protein
VVGVEGLAWYRYEATAEAGGIGREFEERAKAMGAASPETQSLSWEIDSGGFKVVADRLVEEAGVHPLLHRAFAAPVMDGDADVAHRAGAPTRKTPVEEMQAASVMFHLSGVDRQAFLAGIRADPATYADWSAGEWAVSTAGKEDELFSPFLPTTGRYLHIPYRSMLPRGVRNMACCAVTGQAAGIAAALSVRTGQPFHYLDTSLVQAELDRQGVRHQ